LFSGLLTDVINITFLPSIPSTFRNLWHWFRISDCSFHSRIFDFESNPGKAWFEITVKPDVHSADNKQGVHFLMYLIIWDQIIPKWRLVPEIAASLMQRAVDNFPIKMTDSSLVKTVVIQKECDVNNVPDLSHEYRATPPDCCLTLPKIWRLRYHANILLWESRLAASGRRFSEKSLIVEPAHRTRILLGVCSSTYSCYPRSEGSVRRRNQIDLVCPN
jgi:hypothetical protein